MSALFGQVQTFTQKKGPAVQLRVQGDEFYARYETLGGYTVVYDDMLGLYCYAKLVEGELVSSAVSIAKPPPADLALHLKESGEVRNSKFDQRFLQTRPPEQAGQPVPEVFGPNNGLLDGRQVNTGKVKGLTIMVNFQDVQTMITADQVRSMLNDDNYTTNGNFCSVRGYYRLMSSGLLDYENVVVGPITLSQPRHHYISELLAEEALNAVADMGVDFSQFDSKHEHIIDAVSFLYAGDAIYQDWLWPHNSYLEWEHGGYKTNFYQITGLGETPDRLTIGTFCHESGHMLCRFPDLYDYGKRDGDFEASAGMGGYCLMGAGNYNNDSRTPSPVCAYLRYLTKWCTKVISLNKAGVYEAKHGAYDTVHLFQSGKKNEYFLVENRSRLELDEYGPDAGLAVYHCDILGSNEHQGGSAARHYQCALLQADGKFDLEKNANQGDKGDMYVLVAGAALNDTTNPSSRLWNNTSSGLWIEEVGPAAETMRFRVRRKCLLSFFNQLAGNTN